MDVLQYTDRYRLWHVPVLCRVTLVGMRRTIAGFTIVELMVTISIISILAVIVYANVGQASPKARDIDRQADLRNLQSAIERYKQKKGTYPPMGTDANADGIASESEDTGMYIVGLAPEFITVLPKDPKRGSAAGYSYATNNSAPNNIGTSYKVMAVDTVESETVTNVHPMKRCENSSPNICNVGGVCNPNDSGYQKTYALWGGFADGVNDAQVRIETGNVICK